MTFENTRFRPYVRPPDDIDPVTGLPKEHFPDRYSRIDELLVEEIKLLRDILVKLGGTGGGGGTVTLESEKAKNLQITSVPFNTADAEVKYQFALGTKSFLMHTRNGNTVRMSTQQGKVESSIDPYFTLKPNTVYNQDELNVRDFSQTFYFACSVAGEVLEIIIGV